MCNFPYVTFSVLPLQEPYTRRVAYFYVGATTFKGLAYGYSAEIIDFTKQNSIL